MCHIFYHFDDDQEWKICASILSQTLSDVFSIFFIQLLNDIVQIVDLFVYSLSTDLYVYSRFTHFPFLLLFCKRFISTLYVYDRTVRVFSYYTPLCRSFHMRTCNHRVCWSLSPFSFSRCLSPVCETGCTLADMSGWYSLLPLMWCWLLDSYRLVCYIPLVCMLFSKLLLPSYFNVVALRCGTQLL